MFKNIKQTVYRRISNPLAAAVTAFLLFVSIPAAPAVVKAQGAEASSKTPQSGSGFKPLDGKTTIDDKVQIETDILGRIAAREAAKAIAYQAPSSAKTIVLYDSSIEASLRLYTQFLVMMDLLSGNYNELPSVGGEINELASPAFVFDAVSAFANSALSTLALFRQEVEYHGRTVTITEGEFRAYLAAALKQKGLIVYDPKLFLPGPSDIHSVNETDTYRSVTDLFKYRLDVRKRLQAAVEKRKTATGENAANLDDKIGRYEAWIEAADRAIKIFDVPEIDSAVDENNKVKQPTGALSLILRAETLAKMVADDACILQALSTSVGGTYSIRRNLFTTLFTGDLLRYNGGATTYYIYLTKSGEIYSAGEFHHVSGYTKFKRLIKEDDASNIHLADVGKKDTQNGLAASKTPSEKAKVALEKKK